MLKLNHGTDILAASGGVNSIAEARAILTDTLDDTNLAKLDVIKTEDAWVKIANAVKLCEPDDVFVLSGSIQDRDEIRRRSIKKGEEKPLTMKDHTIHYDLPEEQGRIVDRTFYIVNEDEDTSVLAKTMIRDEAMEYVREHMRGIMKGKTMFVGFFSRGPQGAKLALPAIEISSSTYVMHSGLILYRNCFGTFDDQVKRSGTFLTNVHSEGLNRPEDLQHARVFMDRSWLTTFSMFCTYAGNTLLLKKGNHRMAVDLACYYGNSEALSEHMFITGMKDDSGRITWFAGAAPSGCGKTTTAMAGTDFVGDDLAQMWVDEDGTMRAINPEQGIFGIVADVNREGDPYLMKALREEGTEVIWSNVLVDDEGVTHWMGNGEEHPEHGVNFQGEWHKGKTKPDGTEIPISHPNARCTLRCDAIDNYNREHGEDPAGVPVKVVTYSGRDSDTMPPVWVGKSPDHGVVIGASIVSAATATEIGASGVKRQPWANAPFIPGPLADYMKVQFEFFNSSKFDADGQPVLAGLNYFLTDEARGGSSKKLLGEKRDVKVWLAWLAAYANGDVEAIETPIGYIPRYEDLHELFHKVIGKEYEWELYVKHFSLYIDNILSRIELQRDAFGKEKNLPSKLFEVYDEWESGLNELQQHHGSVVSPDQLQAFTAAG
ncbi:phosphoenolpyruvate carboxykinase (GTP) [bacterium]|nr:phosphoenolpyruvate carboxykinase (GTP) [bacterium]